MAAVERLAAVEESAVQGGGGGDAQGVALAAPYGRPLIERSPLDIVQLGGAEEVGDLARHVEGDRRFRGLNVLVGGRLLGQKVGDGRADGAATDTVLTGESGDGLAAQYAVRTSAIVSTATAGRRPPLLPASGLVGSHVEVSRIPR
ncbi:hypothetical protein [Streptomyces olivaceus]|uniref:hypothetical protein n=2 Tax=Streptomyces olivaceus TaxID=47716 RepID=UPI0036EEE2E4